MTMNDHTNVIKFPNTDDSLNIALSALNAIAQTKYGLQNVMEDGTDPDKVIDYFSTLAFTYENIAKTALARIEGVDTTLRIS